MGKHQGNDRMVISSFCYHFNLACGNYQLTDEVGILDCLECYTSTHFPGTLFTWNHQ